MQSIKCVYMYSKRLHLLFLCLLRQGELKRKKNMGHVDFSRPLQRTPEAHSHIVVSGVRWWPSC